MDPLLANKTLFVILDKYSTTISSGFGNVIFTRLICCAFYNAGVGGSSPLMATTLSQKLIIALMNLLTSG